MRFLKDTQALQNEEENNENFPEFVSKYLLNKYNKKEIDKKVIDFIMSIDFFSKKYEDIKIFSKFLTEEFDIDDLIFFLFVRSCIEKELKIFFLEKSKENIKNFSNFDEVEQNNIFVPVKTCKKIGISIYGDNDDELLNKYYEKIKDLTENESLNNKKQFIKASSILSFSVEDYHNSRGANEDNESEIHNFEPEDKNNNNNKEDEQESKNKTIDLEESNNDDLLTNSKLQSIENLKIIEDNEHLNDENENNYYNNNNVHKSEIKNKPKIPEINNFKKINNIKNNNTNISKTSRTSNAKHLSNIELPNPKINKIIENKRSRKSSQNSNNNKTFSNSRNIVNGLKQINNKKMNIYNPNKIGNNSFNRSINSAKPSTFNTSFATTNTSLKKNSNKINVNKINNNNKLKLSNNNKINNINNTKSDKVQKSKEFLQILTKFKADKTQTKLEKKTTLKNIINEYCKIKELDNYFDNLINSNSLFNGLSSQINKTINSVKDSTLKNISVLNDLIASNESETFLSFMKIKENDLKAKLNFKNLNNSFNQMMKKEKLIFIDEQDLIDYINIIFNISEFNLQTTKLLLKNLD